MKNKVLAKKTVKYLLVFEVVPCLVDILFEETLHQQRSLMCLIIHVLYQHNEKTSLT